MNLKTVEYRGPTFESKSRIVRKTDMIPEFSNAETRVKPLAYVRLSYY
jgi:hypothetical protein